MTRYKVEPNKYNPGESTQWQAFSDKPIPDTGFEARWKPVGAPEDYRAAAVTYDHEAEEPYEPDQQAEKGEMFEHFPGEIRAAFADPSMRQHIPTLLGLATQQHQRLAGSSYALPQASENLSVHSSRMVAHLRERGIDVPTHPDNPKAEQNNEYQLQTFGMSDSPDQVLLDDATVKSGRDLMRGMLRRPHISPTQFPEHDYKQGKLFD